MLTSVLHFLIGYTAVSVCFSFAIAQFIRQSRKWSGWKTGADSQTTIVAATGISDRVLFPDDLISSDSATVRLLALQELLTPERVLRREPAQIDWAARAEAGPQAPRPLVPAAFRSPRRRAEAPLSEISPVPIL